ncbi:MAG: hypothetical protein V3R52_00840 [Candidatus Neomarinimicrobiota bacterium]
MKKQPAKDTMSIPKSLQRWFIVHFVVDIIFAIPLIFFPLWILGLFGLPASESVMARLVGAALIGIGGASFFSYKRTKESYDILLTLKLLWSSSAVLALVLAVVSGAPNIIWLIILIFVIFFFLWLYYKNRLKKI